MKRKEQKVLRIVERVTEGVTRQDDNSSIESLRVFLGEVKMLSLKSIYKTVELNGIPVTLLGVQNNVALFMDIDGNEIEVSVSTEPTAAEGARLLNQRDRLNFVGHGDFWTN